MKKSAFRPGPAPHVGTAWGGEDRVPLRGGDPHSQGAHGHQDLRPCPPVGLSRGQTRLRWDWGPRASSTGSRRAQPPRRLTTAPSAVGRVAGDAPRLPMTNSTHTRHTRRMCPHAHACTHGHARAHARATRTRTRAHLPLLVPRGPRHSAESAWRCAHSEITLPPPGAIKASSGGGCPGGRWPLGTGHSASLFPDELAHAAIAPRWVSVSSWPLLQEHLRHC